MQLRNTALFIVLSGCFLFTVNSSAETILLKNGEIINAKVLRKNNEYTTVLFDSSSGSLVAIYFNYEIQSVESNKAVNQGSQGYNNPPPAITDELLNRRFYVWLLASDKEQGCYKNERPQFSLCLPDGLTRNWVFYKPKDPTAQGYVSITDDEIFSKIKTAHPRIDVMANEIPQSEMGKGAAELFKEICASYASGGADIKIINNGSQLADINGFKAFERVDELISQDRRRHAVFIFFGNYFLAAKLDTKTTDFDKDDADFLSIVSSFSAK